ncbi:hypothetical protein [Virgibacillus sp. LDC-1]|uniref:hypothetical protein n=1 Tax=Virgibacillus sp. LDC-1 TaxID=3039856 RepID=UPI0024DE3991|nr:hypothetical protein [Virgibacillus sp. LDC-1]
MRHDQKNIYKLCKEHMHSYVLVELHDGSTFDGIVTGLDEEYAYFAVPISYNETDSPMVSAEESRFLGYGYPGFGFGYPGFYGPFGYGGYGFYPRRFRRLILPLAAIVALSALPWY